MPRSTTQGVSGFLKKADAAAAEAAAGGALKAGTLLDVAIVSAEDRRMVVATAAAEAVAGGLLKEDALTDLGAHSIISISQCVNHTTGCTRHAVLRLLWESVKAQASRLNC